MSRKPISIVKVRLAGKGEHSAGHVGPGRHVGCSWLLQTSGHHLPSSFSLVAGTVPSTCQIPTVGGSFLQSSCNVFLHIPPFSPSRQQCCLVRGAEKAEVLGSVDSIHERLLATDPFWRRCQQEEAWTMVGEAVLLGTEEQVACFSLGRVDSRGQYDP